MSWGLFILIRRIISNNIGKCYSRKVKQKEKMKY